MRAELLAHRNLPGLGHVEQLTQMVDEDIDAVCLKYLTDERAVDMELSLHVSQRAPDFRQAVVLADRVQDVRFDEVEERQRGRRASSDGQNGFEFSHP